MGSTGDLSRLDMTAAQRGADAVLEALHFSVLYSLGTIRNSQLFLGVLLVEVQLSGFPSVALACPFFFVRLPNLPVAGLPTVGRPQEAAVAQSAA